MSSDGSHICNLRLSFYEYMVQKGSLVQHHPINLKTILYLLSIDERVKKFKNNCEILSSNSKHDIHPNNIDTYKLS